VEWNSNNAPKRNQNLGDGDEDGARHDEVEQLRVLVRFLISVRIKNGPQKANCSQTLTTSTENMKSLLSSATVLAAAIIGVHSHGAVIYPPSRNAADRFLPSFSGGQ
jgi:hypothetical protein